MLVNKQGLGDFPYKLIPVILAGQDHSEIGQESILLLCLLFAAKPICGLCIVGYGGEKRKLSRLPKSGSLKTVFRLFLCDLSLKKIVSSVRMIFKGICLFLV